MKTIQQLFKQVLASECLTKEEKYYLKVQFNNFMMKRELMKRKSVRGDETEESVHEFRQNNFV